MIIKLAWRNLWRQKRRTILTAGSVALTLALSLFMRAMQEGVYTQNIDNSARFYTGYLQLQHPDYQDSSSIDDVISGHHEFVSALNQISDISHIIPRIESYALAAYGERSKGVMILGIAPDEEAAYSEINQRISAGQYFSATAQGVLIGEGVAQHFNLNVGDELILYGQGYQGQTAAGVYPVLGIVKFPIKEIDRQLVYLPLRQAQELFGLGQQVTSWVLHTHDIYTLPIIQEWLQQQYADQAVVRSWREMSPEMAQQIDLDRVSGIFLMYILYGIVGFGVFATLIMMVLERQREFAVMIATGLERRKLLALVMIESFFMSMFGIVCGLAVALPIIFWFVFHPISLSGEYAEMMLELGWEPVLPVLLTPRLLIEQVAMVLLIVCLCLGYPLWRVWRLNVVAAIKGGAHAD
ncbi:ABC transporter permease [Thaumasiovibrio sp. DFM-14]|uniref:ABC transporter permease n=1 Tax=Thaumasiovibrio sp. DFM-14 TaxID=3384792 RepID=UPI0039A1D28F